MLTYDLEARDGVPLYEYLYRRVRDDILSGALAAGERLSGYDNVSIARGNFGRIAE